MVCRIRLGTTIISARGTVVNCAMVVVPMVMNQSCYGIRGVLNDSDNYSYYLLRSNIADLQSRGHGSVFNTITRETFSTIQVVEPTLNILTHYEDRVSAFFEKILINVIQNNTLTLIRDTLLPRVMSGEIEI